MDLPGWAWLLITWLLLSVGFALGVGRWFRWLREDDSEREWHG